MKTKGEKIAGLVETPDSVSKDAETTPARPYSRAMIPITKTGLKTRPLPNTPKRRVTVPTTEIRKTRGYAGFRLLEQVVPP